MRARVAILLGCTMALGGCAYGYGGYGPYGGLSAGLGYGSGYGGYGGYGYNGCYDPYSAAGGYGGYDYYGFPVGGYGYGSCGGYGYGSSYYGWNGDYYYPGSGYYVYDRYRRPHRWNDQQKRYWTDRRERAMSTTRTTTGTQQPVMRENWGGFDRSRAASEPTAQTQRVEVRQEQREDRQQVRQQRRDDRKSDSTRPQ